MKQLEDDWRVGYFSQLLRNELPAEDKKGRAVRLCLFDSMVRTMDF